MIRYITFRSSHSTLSTCGFSWQQHPAEVDDARVSSTSATVLRVAAETGLAVTLALQFDDVRPHEESSGTTDERELELVVGQLTRTHINRAKYWKATRRTPRGSGDVLSLMRNTNMEVMTDAVDSPIVTITNTPDWSYTNDDHSINRLHNGAIFCRATLCIHVARPIPSRGVCLSVTIVCCLKTSNHILNFFPPSGSRSILVFPHQTLWQYSHGDMWGIKQVALLSQRGRAMLRVCQ